MKQALSLSNTDNPFKDYLKPHAYLTSEWIAKKIFPEPLIDWIQF